LLSIDSPDGDDSLFFVESSNEDTLLLSESSPDDDVALLLLSFDSVGEEEDLLSVDSPDGDDSLFFVESSDDDVEAALLLSIGPPDDEVSLSADPLTCLIAVAGKINEINNKSTHKLDILFMFLLLCRYIYTVFFTIKI